MKYFIISEKKGQLYNLTELIPEFMKVERKTEQEAIDYFMEGLHGSRFMKFPEHTPRKVILEWITQLRKDIPKLKELN